MVNPEGKKPLGKPESIWEDNIRMDLRGIIWEVSDWIHLAQDRASWLAFAKTVINIRVP
jgi:hypothetical protein